MGSNHCAGATADQFLGPDFRAENRQKSDESAMPDVINIMQDHSYSACAMSRPAVSRHHRRRTRGHVQDRGLAAVESFEQPKGSPAGAATYGSISRASPIRGRHARPAI
jgi:hypothetical protein